MRAILRWQMTLRKNGNFANKLRKCWWKHSTRNCVYLTFCLFMGRLDIGNVNKKSVKPIALAFWSAYAVLGLAVDGKRYFGQSQFVYKLAVALGKRKSLLNRAKSLGLAALLHSSSFTNRFSVEWVRPKWMSGLPCRAFVAALFRSLWIIYELYIRRA